MHPEDEAYLLVKQALSMHGTLQSAAIAAARLRQLNQMGLQGSEILRMAPQSSLGLSEDHQQQRPGLPQAGEAASYAPVGTEVEGAY